MAAVVAGGGAWQARRLPVACAAASLLFHGAAAMVVLLWSGQGSGPEGSGAWQPGVEVSLAVDGLAGGTGEAIQALTQGDIAEPVPLVEATELVAALEPEPALSDQADAALPDIPPTPVAAAAPPSLPVADVPARVASAAPARRATVPRPPAAAAMRRSPSGMPSGDASVPAGGPARAAPAGDEGPVLLANPRFRMPPIAPAYPMRARDLGQEGEVVVRARLDPRGTPEEVVVYRSSGFDLLDRAALAAVRRWAFEPGRRGGAPVAAWVQVPVRFALR
jgi:protein TonB